MVGSTGSFGSGSGDIYLLKLGSLGSLEWSRTYGGAGVNQGRSVKTMPDGGFAIAGITSSPPSIGYDGFLIRTDASGALLWDHRYGGADWDLFNGLSITMDGFVMTGVSYSVGDASGDIWVVRAALSGDTLWTRYYASSSLDIGHGIAWSADAGILVAGGMMSATGTDDAVVLNYSMDGDVQWITTLEGTVLMWPIQWRSV